MRYGILWTVCVLLIVAQGANGAMFNPRMYDNARPDGLGVLEAVSEPSESGAPRFFVPLKRTELHGEIAGPLVTLRLTQVYGYSRAQSDRVLEALYRFPLPGDAAVTGVRVVFGKVEIQATLRPREEAKAEYEAAKKAGKQAALTTRESPDVFTLQLAGIRPDEDIRVETSYVQLARAEDAGWSLRVPLTTAPRYVRSDEAGSRHARGQPLILLRDPGHRFVMDVKLQASARVMSPTHALAVSEEAGGLRVKLKDGEVIPNRDCVLSWTPRQSSKDPGLNVMLHKASDWVYFLALVAPPSGVEAGRVPREVVLLVDHSGSMKGPKWEAADWAVERFLSDLAEKDALGLALFHSTTRWFSENIRGADPKTVQSSIQFLKKNRDSGGTELGVALEQALSMDRSGGEKARHLLVITDAQVTDADRILRLADEEAQRDKRRRISVLCIDAAPNAFLATELARRSGGVARFLTSDPDAEDITTALESVLTLWSAPVLTGLQLRINRPDVQTAHRATVRHTSGYSAVDLGDLPAGRPVWTVGRVPKGSENIPSFSLTDHNGQSLGTVQVDSIQGAGLKALFGARRVQGLEFLIHSGYAGQDLKDQLDRLGYDPKQILANQGSNKVYAENIRKDAHNALRKLLVREALSYGLASSETGFVAVRKEAGKPVEGTVVVANALPAGWSGTFESRHVMLMQQARKPALRGGAGILGVLASPPPQAPDRQVAGVRGAEKEAEGSTGSSARSAALFSGIPTFANGEAVLFDASVKAAGKLPESGRFVRLIGALQNADAAAIDPRVRLLIFVGDPAFPRASIRVANWLRQGGMRPLNLRKSPGDEVRILLVDPSGKWGQLHLELSLEWE